MQRHHDPPEDLRTGSTSSDEEHSSPVVSDDDANGIGSTVDFSDDDGILKLRDSDPEDSSSANEDAIEDPSSSAKQQQSTLLSVLEHQQFAAVPRGRSRQKSSLSLSPVQKKTSALQPTGVTRQQYRLLHSEGDRTGDSQNVPDHTILQENHDAAEESDSSSEGDLNPVGNIPMRWYDGYDHIGYSRDGERIVRSNKPSPLELAADPHAWRRIYDEKNDQEIVLSHEELQTIARVRAGRYPSASRNPESDEIIAWSGPVEKHPLTSAPEPKRRFLPSRHEARAIVTMVRAIRAGKLKRPSERERERAEKHESMYNFDVWEDSKPKDVGDQSKSERARALMRVPAPKVDLPKNDESYNPPAEYLPTEAESKAWAKTDPDERAVNYLPTKYDALRHVPLYENFIKERFERCLDLYLGVRVLKAPDNVKADELIPDLPSPRDLRPFPTGCSASFGPLPSRSRSISIHPRGFWLLTGSDDGAVRLWEVLSGRLRYTWWLSNLLDKVDGQSPPITCVAWCPVENVHVFAATIGTHVLVVSAAEALGISNVDSLELMGGNSSESSSPDLPEGISWEGLDPELPIGSNRDDETLVKAGTDGFAFRIQHTRPLRIVTWHAKGDYFATVGKDSTGGTVAVHRISRRSSQVPFKKKTAGVQTVCFHPSRPFFFVATMHHVRIYNLSAQETVKTLKPGVRWISSLDIHPSGDHVIVGSYDKKLCWFDLDMALTPYKVIRNHAYAVRAAKFHPRLPLFADASDDGSSHVFHGMVYDDLNRDALIVPVKKLERAHSITNSLGILDIAWHPSLPWLFTTGADRQLHMYTDMS